MSAIPRTPAAMQDFIRQATQILSPPLLPEIRLYTATEATALWALTEEALAERGLPPPFWAFPWAGGQALARWLLDDPTPVRGKRVLCVGAGSGVDAIAAAMAGASAVWANDIDPFALAAITLNAALNDVAVVPLAGDIIGGTVPAPAVDVILAGDICYEGPMAEAAFAWLRQQTATVYVGDPGRSYLPRRGLVLLARFATPTTRAIEDSDVRNACVWALDH